MSEQRICDVCKTRSASRSYKISESLKGYWHKSGKYSGWWNHSNWTPYKTIDIYGECAEILLGLQYRDEFGMPHPSIHKE